MRLDEVRILAYYYQILDVQEREILAYHWHPAGASSVTHPHLHLSNRIPALDLGHNVPPVSLAEMHLPTGHVTFADVVRLLITEFGVEPRRDDWEATLREGSRPDPD